MAREFEFYFLPWEVDEISGVVVAPTMILVSSELADDGILTLFNLNQALQHRSTCGMYFRSELSDIPSTSHVLANGALFFHVDDLRLPEHLGLFAHRSIPPSLPRISISLASSFSDGAVQSPRSERISQVFATIRSKLAKRARKFKHSSIDVFVSELACQEIRSANWTTGIESLDKEIAA